MHDESAPSQRPRSPGLQRRSLRLLPLKLASAYFLVAALWIFLAHFWLDTLLLNPVALTHLQSTEDLLFVSITAGVLYWLARRALRTLQQTETTLRYSEERLRLILQNMPVMLDAFDHQGDIIIWNQECARVTGYSAEEVIDNPEAMAWLYPDAAYRQQMIADWAERGNDYRNWEWDLVCKDGSRRTVAWSTISDRFPIPGWASWRIGVDVTNRKQTEAAMYARNRELLTLHRISEITLNQQSLQAAFQTIVKEISVATAFPIIAIELYDATRQVMVFEGVEGIPLPPDGRPIEVPVTQTSSGTVVQTGQLLVKTYDPHEPKKCDSNESLSQLGIKTFVCVPMTVNQTTIGVLSLAHPDVVHTEDDFLQWLTSLASYLALLTNHQRTEVALHESKEFFKLALDFTHIGSWDWHVPTNEVIWNENHACLLGLVPGEVQASYQAWRDRVHPDDLDRVEQAVTQALETRTNFEAEYRVLYPDGSLHWLIGRGRCIYDASGQVSRMIGVIFDITDRKHAEDALRESEAQFRSLSVCSPVGIYLASPEGYGTYTNPRYQEIFGFTLEESIGNGWAKRVHPDDREWLVQEWTAAAAAGSTYVTDYRVQPREGVVRWVQSRSAPMYSDDGELTGHVGTIEDITERKQAEQQIRMLNETLEQQNLELEALVEQRTAELMTFINALPDYIFVVERDTMRMSFCNDLAAQLIGWESRHQVEGKTIFECFTPALAANFANQNHQVFASGETLHFQEIYPTPLGILHFDTYKIPLKKPNGEVYALIGTSRDVTELVQARQALVDRTTQLETVNRELESFSYSVSHDLRAPLRHVHGFVAALAERLEQNEHLIDPKVIHYLQVIQNSSQTMGQLIDGLLTLSRIGRQQMAHAPVDLYQLVTTVLSQLPEGSASGTTPELADSGQPAQFSVGDLPTVMGDATLLQQVFVNLIENAIKFSRVRETSAKQNRQPVQIEIGTLPDGIIFVRDHGVGFQMEYADQLFGAFQRLHSRSEFEGNGIGLAIVQRIIHRHGGQIWAESQPGEGASFYFKLDDRPVAAKQPDYSMGLAPDARLKP